MGSPTRECLYCGWPMHVEQADPYGGVQWACAKPGCNNTLAIDRAAYDAWLARQTPKAARPP